MTHRLLPAVRSCVPAYVRQQGEWHILLQHHWPRGPIQTHDRDAVPGQRQVRNPE